METQKERMINIQIYVTTENKNCRSLYQKKMKRR